MSKRKQIRVGLVFFFIAQAFLSLTPPTAVSASTLESAQPRTFEPSPVDYPRPTDLLYPPLRPVESVPLTPRANEPRANDESPAPAPPLENGTTLTVSIISSPWTTRDHNWKPGSTEEVPRVFVVEAVITNTGSTTARGVHGRVDNYNQEPWVLLGGEEDADHSGGDLAPGEAYHAYWLARYSMSVGDSHRYTVTAYATNAITVATSDNSYGNPPSGDTVQTRAYQSTGNSGISQVGAEVVVGVAFTITVGYNLGTNPTDVAFSPVGNTDFDPGAYRLLASQVRFYDDEETQQSIVYNRLYFPTVPSFADNAEVTYTFIALTPSNTRLCSYTAVGYQSSDKYDQFYCSEEFGTVVPITGTLALSMTKHMDGPTIDPTVQQSQTLTYTIDITNTGSLTMSYAWIWDDVPPYGSIITPSIEPEPRQTSDDQVVWYYDEFRPGQTDTLTFTFSVDGRGRDLTDTLPLVNNAHFGIEPGSSLPRRVALTSTVTTTVQAPTISLSKTDERGTAEAGEVLTYALRITNSGSITATGLVITDVLPADLNYTPGAADPPETSPPGQTLIWNNQGPIAPNGGIVVITIPVTVRSKVSNGTTLANTMTVKYENPAGWVFATQTATDTTTVQAPDLTISKSDSPDPVVTGNLIDYTLYYANNGPVAATNVVITDRVPVSTTYESCSPTPSCSLINGSVVSWTISTIPGGGNGTVSFSARVLSETLNTGDTISNTEYGIVAYGTITDQTGFIPGSLVTTTVNRNAALINVYAFEDVNGNGISDTVDFGLPGITVTLAGLYVQPPITATTSITGFHRFRVETAGPISVTAAMPLTSGYFRTTPATVLTDSVLGITKTVYFGYAFSSTFGVIYGTVFEDINYNGNQDLGENGLPGVTITSIEAVASPVTTNEYGGYTLRYNISDTVTITEANPRFYVSTTPDVVHTRAMTGSSGHSPIDFGDFLGIKVTGQVFTDTNVNGDKDGDEGGVPGALAGVAGATVAANGDSTTTGSTGVYTLYVTVHDSNPITVTETDPPGYRSTNATPGHFMSRVDPNRLRIDSPISGTVYTGGDFGDVQATQVITISGYVWDDNGAGGGELANGWRDGTEPGLAGAVVSLSSGVSQTTGSDGTFLRYAPPDTVITVTEKNPTGYTSTEARPGNGAVKVDHDTLVVSDLSAGSTSDDNLFGDVLMTETATITGVVFDDANENGSFEGAETGMPGVIVALEISGGNTISMPTDSSGHYQFSVAPGTDIRITSAGPGGGFYPTTPPSVTLRSPPAGVYPGNNFGYSDDTDVAVIYGTVYDDTDGDGYQEFGELGLAGAVITLTNSGAPITITTSGNGVITGTFGFTVTQPGIYGVHEQDPEGYRSTTSNDINVTVELGESYPVDFGDTNNPDTASIYGIVFDDLNGNGEQDDTEPGIPGVVISATIGMEPYILTTTTRAQGQYNPGYGFRVQDEGLHTVSEQDPVGPGYRSTTVDEVVVDIKVGESFEVNFGDTQTTTFSTIMGTVFDDRFADGVRDPDAEPGIPDVLVSLYDPNGQQISSTRTNEYGNYTFPISDTGYVKVVETDKDGYHSTTPNTVTLHVAALAQVYTVNFGDRSDNRSGVSFFGTVFDDQNANEARDLELGLEGVRVTITGTSAIVPDFYVTNRWGQFTFLIEVTGTYTIAETNPSGYVSTSAIPGDPAVTKVDNDTLRATTAITPGADLGDNLFGDVRAEPTTLTVSKSAVDLDGPPLVISDAVRYTWQVTNTGSYTAFNTTLTDDLPDQVTYVGASADRGTPTGTDPLIWAVPTLPTNTAATLFITVTIDPDAAGQSITNTGSVTGTNVPEPPPPPPPVCPDGSTPIDGECPTRPVPTVSFDTATQTVGEDEGTVTITVTLSAASTQVITIPYTVSGTATGEGVDHDLADGVIVVAAGDLSSSVTFNVTPDSLYEDNETVIVTMGTPVNAIPGAPTVQAITIVDDDSAALSINDVTVNEGNSGTRDAIFIVTLSTESSFTVTVDYTTADGTATAAEDYVSTSGTLTFTSGITAQQITVAVVGDTDNEDDETFNVNLTNAINATIADSQGRGTILNDDGSATITGTVFEDTNGNGVQDTDEVGIPGVTITFDGITHITTNSSGVCTFTTTITGPHTIVETDPPGYFSTTPNTVTLDVELGRSYRVDFGDQAGCICPPDRYEDDDDVVQADGLTLLAPGVKQEHNFCDDAIDWARFSAKANDVYTITTSSWGQRADTFLALFGSDGQTLLAASDDYEATTDYSSRVVWQAPVAGVYYARVTNQAELTGCATDYDLVITTREIRILYLPIVVRNFRNPVTLTRTDAMLSPMGVITHTCPDDYEIDDTWEQARPIQPGVAQVHSFDSDPEHYAADKDFVSFDISTLAVATGKSITFTIAPVTSTQTAIAPVANVQTVMELHDVDGAALAIAGSTRLVWKPTTPGHYYLSVRPADESTPYGCVDVAGYSLRLEMAKTSALYIPVVVRNR